jgi:hypothetical protein
MSVFVVELLIVLVSLDHLLMRFLQDIVDLNAFLFQLLHVYQLLLSHILWLKISL